MTSPSNTGATTAASQTKILLFAVFFAYLAQMTLNPIIAPLSREVGLAEWQIGATISAAAVMVVLTSGLWGRRSQSWGRKPVLMLALAFATVAMALFALASWAGMAGIVTGTALFVLFVLCRGVGFGGALAAIAPTAQAYIADVTEDEKARVKGIAGIGAVQGIAMISGALVGGTLALFGLITPLVAIPVLLVIAFSLVAFRLRRETRTELIEKPLRVRPTDTRVWPFLVTGFGMFTALGLIQIITGFIVQDRLKIDADMTGTITGGALFLAGIGMVVAQAVIVPRSGWAPPTLLRTGGVTALIGFVLFSFDFGAWSLLVALFFIGLGLGVAMPGFMAGSTLLVTREEQGGLAGLNNATIALTFVVAPLLGTSLYGVNPVLPIAIGAVVMAFVTAFVWLHPRFRRPVSQAQESSS